MQQTIDIPKDQRNLEISGAIRASEKVKNAFDPSNNRTAMYKVLHDMVKKQSKKNPKNNILNYYPFDVRNQHLIPDSSSDEEDSESEGEKQEPYIPSQSEKELLK